MIQHQLREKIISAFSDVTFPKHLGIHAAEAMDDWVSDPEKLKGITAEKDFSGHWLDIPESHISGNSLGFNYLDSKSIEYYLPAFMVLAIDKPIYKNLYTLGYYLCPDDNPELYGYFQDRLSRITGIKKEVCVEFMKYLKVIIKDHSSEEADSIEKAINHRFWQTSS